MQAVIITRYGGPEVIEVREVPEPAAPPGSVAVEVEAGGVNFADFLAARGAYPGLPGPPLIAGREFAGRRLDTGERVMGYAQHSAFAERIVSRPEFVWPAPPQWDAETAAAFPVNFFTAYLAFWKAGMTSEEGVPPLSRQSGNRPPRVLIHAVAGGVGTAAAQIGRALGVEMFGTSSSDEKLERVKELGLQHAINYADHDYVERVRDLTGGEGVDAVFEMLGGGHVARSVACLAFLGRVITYGSASGERAAFDPRILYERQTSVHGLWLSKLATHPEVMGPAWQRLSQWIAEDRLRPVVGHVLPIERAGDAYRLLVERKNYGKVVLKIGSN
jgi:NADPH:quinone reductase-like Zn-dependent oxidoreductase